MEMNTLFELIYANPACYFVIGFILGFLIRGLFVKGFSAKSQNKKPNRYQGLNAKATPNKTSVVADLQEPSFDWPDISKTVASKRFAAAPMEHSGNEA